MPKTPTLAALFAAGIAVAGCSQWNNFIVGRADYAVSDFPANEWDTADGNYKGRAKLAASQSAACPGSSWGKIEVGDDRLDFAYQPGTIFVVPIPPDGKLHAVSGPSVLDGWLVGGRLQFTVKTPVCESRYDMRHVL